MVMCWLAGEICMHRLFLFLKKLKKHCWKQGAGLTDVVRTRMFITDISTWEEAGKAHGEFFKNIKPVATMVEVSNLIDADLLIEIEVTAILQNR